MTAELKPVTPIYTEEMQRLILRAQEGDFTSLTELRALLDERRDLWQNVGDLAQHAELNIVRLAAGKDLFAQEAMRRKLAELKEDLAGPSPSQVENLVGDRTGVCGLPVSHRKRKAPNGRGSTNPPRAFSAPRRFARANRRYLSSIRQLATVRRLLGFGQSPNEASPASTSRK